MIDDPVAGEHAGSRDDVDAGAAPSLLRRIEAVFARLAVAFPDLAEPTFECPDCLDHGWIRVPCMDSKCLCAKVKGWAGPEGHQVARACLSCERGIEREAGIWFRFLYRRGQKGKLEIVEAHVPKYERAMIRMGAPAKRVQLVLDSIFNREKTRKGAA